MESLVNPELPRFELGEQHADQESDRPIKPSNNYVDHGACVINHGRMPYIAEFRYIQYNLDHWIGWVAKLLAAKRQKLPDIDSEETEVENYKLDGIGHRR